MKKSILTILLIIASHCLYADAIQSLEVLKNKIETYVLSQLDQSSKDGKIKITSGKIDPRLTLRACAEEKLGVFNPYDTPMLTTTTMGIKCLEDTNHWTLYVPIKVSILKTVLVTKRALRQGERLTNNDFYSVEMNTQKLKQGYFTASNELAGLVCKKDISPDTPLTPYNVELAKMVFKGEEVTIVAQNGALTVSMGGVAMTEGSIGDSIQVRNSNSKRVIEAQVTGRKKVKVRL